MVLRCRRRGDTCARAAIELNRGSQVQGVSPSPRRQKLQEGLGRVRVRGVRMLARAALISLLSLEKSDRQGHAFTLLRFFRQC